MADAHADPEAPEEPPPGRLSWACWNQIVRDFDRAIALAWLTGPQNFLLQQAREESWTKSKIAKFGVPYRFRLNLTNLARLLGCDRSRLSDAQGALVEMNIFIKDADGLYSINKDFRTWTAGPIPRGHLLDEDQVRFARSSRDLAKGSAHPPADRAENRTPVAENRTVNAGSACGKPHAPRAENRTPPVRKTARPEADAPNRNAGVGESERREKEKTSPSPLRPPDARGVVGVESFAVAVPTEPFRTAAELTAWASLAFPGHDKAGRKLELLAAKFTLPWTHEALLRAEIRDPEQPFLWCQKVLREWQAAGGPDGDLDSDRATPRGAPARGPSPLTADDRARRAALRASKPERYDA